MEAQAFETADNRHILVVEDDSELAGMLDYFLRSRGYRVTSVSSGVEGLRAVMAEDYDAILCDMVMPQMPGDMFYLAVRRVRPHLCERFIFVTAHQEQPRVKEFLNQVREMVLRKPFNLDDLAALLGRLFREQAPSSS
jgi:DNA-binding response OmpR family regulator